MAWQSKGIGDPFHFHCPRPLDHQLINYPSPLSGFAHFGPHSHSKQLSLKAPDIFSLFSLARIPYFFFSEQKDLPESHFELKQAPFLVTRLNDERNLRLGILLSLRSMKGEGVEKSMVAFPAREKTDQLGEIFGGMLKY